MRIVKDIIAVVIVIILYVAAMLLCAAVSLYVPRWIAWIIVPVYGFIGVLTAFVAFKVSPDARAILIIAALFVLLSCFLNVFRGLSYRDLAAFLYAGALLSVSESYHG